MKVNVTPIYYNRTIKVGPYIAHAVEAACSEVALSLTGIRGNYPPLTAQLRALNLIYKRITDTFDPTAANTVDPDVVLNGISAVGVTLSRLAMAVTTWSVTQKTKLMQGWEPADIAANALAAMGATVTGATAPLLSQQEMKEMIIYALPGVRPEFTEAESLLTATQLVMLAARTNKLLPRSVKGAQARLALLFLLSWVKAALAEPQGSAQAIDKGKPEEAISARINQLRLVAAYATGVAVAATYNATKHFLAVLRDPFIMSNTTGRAADDLSRLLQTFEERMPPEGPFTIPAFLVRPEEYDLDIVQLPTIEAALVARDTIQDVDAMSDSFHILATDLVSPIAFTREEINVWLDTAWVLTEEAQRAVIEYSRTAYDIASKIPTISYELQLRGEGGVAGINTVPGYPVITSHDPTINWSGSDWSLRRLDLNPRCLVTRRELAKVMREHPLLPVRVTGEAPAFLGTKQITIQPTFRIFDDALPTFTADVESVAALWGTTNNRLQKHLSTLGSQATSLGWRSLAQSVHLVGQLFIGDEIIEPYERAWYHARAFTPACFGTPIPLSTSPRVTLRPFKSIPRSAEMNRLALKLAQTQNGQEMPHLPFIQWIDDEPVSPSTVEITGWATGTDIRDIVLVPTVNPDETYEITAFENVGPFAAHRYNMVASILTPVPTALPPLLNPPTRNIGLVG